jgi:molecular chaperone GrpE
MMKKKTNNQEELKQDSNNKTADNKEHTDKQDNLISGSPEKTSVNGLVGEVAPADNFVAEVRAVEEKLADMQDKYIRLSAEFDNYRKRTLREKMELTKYAGKDLLLKIIPLMDDFDRALQHIDSTTEPGGMKDGIELIYTKFSEFLKQNGVIEIESLNCVFNVDLHEAVAKVPVSDNDQKGKVVEVVLKGYYLQDKVLRFSKVIVGE